MWTFCSNQVEWEYKPSISCAVNICGTHINLIKLTFKFQIVSELVSEEANESSIYKLIKVNYYVHAVNSVHLKSWPIIEYMYSSFSHVTVAKVTAYHGFHFACFMASADSRVGIYNQWFKLRTFMTFATFAQFL